MYLRTILGDLLLREVCALPTTSRPFCTMHAPVCLLSAGNNLTASVGDRPLQTLDGVPRQLPSPEQLKYKIIVKNKKQQYVTPFSMPEPSRSLLSGWMPRTGSSYPCILHHRLSDAAVAASTEAYTSAESLKVSNCASLRLFVVPGKWAMVSTARQTLHTDIAGAVALGRRVIERAIQCSRHSRKVPLCRHSALHDRT